MIYWDFETRSFFFCRAPEGLSTEWAIIELQGNLKSHTESKFNGQFIGDLHYTKTGIPILIIGHHLMYGKEMPLEKPLAVLEKTEGETSEYCVRSIVRRKILFKTRPKPIVGN